MVGFVDQKIFVCAHLAGVLKIAQHLYATTSHFHREKEKYALGQMNLSVYRDGLAMIASLPFVSKHVSMGAYALPQILALARMVGLTPTAQRQHATKHVVMGVTVLHQMYVHVPRTGKGMIAEHLFAHKLVKMAVCV
jgi:hypothetical protein